ncbi:hypothetical protein CY34DRAFT_805057 [Suillus luteus UH-Slu-Lm8-n1]|uniref:Uncharacterized protein n=1 Tax=Suillus luteus UH-Slu-Lm8-n1 TaxID=930992 RepID=A0A0C9ZWY7_9AGAM|nr:hypothetical protein CY34DRAFT_805057 [Suillus luteus UH-Slu-Lm8-n1]
MQVSCWGFRCRGIDALELWDRGDGRFSGDALEGLEDDDSWCVSGLVTLSDVSVYADGAN